MLVWLAAAAKMMEDCLETLHAKVLRVTKLLVTFLVKDHFCWLYAVVVLAELALHLREAAAAAAEVLLLLELLLLS